jgi:hypothetical protein
MNFMILYLASPDDQKTFHWVSTPRQSSLVILKKLEKGGEKNWMKAGLWNPSIKE